MSSMNGSGQTSAGDVETDGPLNDRRAPAEWPTLALIAVTYVVWALGVGPVWQAVPLVGWLIAVLAIVQHSSLQHETIHGHPFETRWMNAALVFPALLLFVPYERFRETHIAHHYDPALTDPYDDPESNYLDPAVWERLSRPMQRLLRVNNSLLGRMVLGPIIGTVLFTRDEIRRMWAGDRAVRRAWALHGAGVAIVLAWLLAFGTMPLWAYVLAAYTAYGVLKIRTFLEHRAHEKARARTVIVEERGPLAFLFLFNNLHVVHHHHPAVPWYRLPDLYALRRERYRAVNEAYVYRSYAQIFRAHFLRAKDPVPHPFYRPH